MSGTNVVECLVSSIKANSQWRYICPSQCLFVLDSEGEKFQIYDIQGASYETRTGQGAGLCSQSRTEIKITAGVKVAIAGPEVDWHS